MNTDTTFSEASIFSNYCANALGHIPARRLGATPVPVALTQWLAQTLFDHEKNLWLFGFQPFECNHAWIQRQFGFPDADRLDDASYSAIIADSWSQSVDSLVSQANGAPIVFLISIGFLAGISDPRPLLLAFKKMALAGNARCLLIYHTHNNQIRQWTCAGIEQFLRVSGFDCSAGYQIDPDYRVFVVTTSKISYARYLASNHLAGADQAELLIVSTEDQSVKPAGDIGRYAAQVKQLNAKCLVLLFDADETTKNDKQLVHITRLIGRVPPEQIMDGFGLIEAVKMALYLFPQLNVCEFQDYLSLGFRIVQARSTGQLPESLRLRVLMHGNIDCIKYSEQSSEEMNYSLEETKNIIKDSYIFKHVDECRVPTEFLAALLTREFGYTLNNTVCTRLPVDLDILSTIESHDHPPVQLSQVRRLVFLGDQGGQKAWQTFISAVQALSHSDEFKRVEELVSISRHAPDAQAAHVLRAIKPYQWMCLSDADFLTYCQAHRHDTLFVCTASGNNFAYPTLMLTLLGCRVTFCGGGATAELCSSAQYISTFVANPDSASIAKKIIELLGQGLVEQSEIVAQTARQSRLLQGLANKHWDGCLTSPDRSVQNQAGGGCGSSLAFDAKAYVDVSVVSPVWNTPLGYLRDLYDSLTVSNIQPREWLLIDDGSLEAYAQELEAFVGEMDRTPGHSLSIRLIRQANRGLAGARNRGLQESRTRYTYFLDSDDALLPHTISDGLVAMQQRPELIVVAGFEVPFEHRSHLDANIEKIKEGCFWKPLGLPEARGYSLLENQYISASGLFNTAALRAVGGWDERSKDTWEDWAFYNQLAWGNMRFSLIPFLGHLYRNTPGSMAKTYNPYFGRRRLVRNFPMLSVLDATVITSMINRPITPVVMQDSMDTLYASRSWRMTKPLRVLGRLFRSDFKGALEVWRNWRF